MRKVCLTIIGVLGIMLTVCSIACAQVPTCTIPAPVPTVTKKGPVTWTPISFAGCTPKTAPLIKSDFVLIKTGTASGTISTVTKISDTSYSVEVSDCKGNGTICVKPADGALLDGSSNPLSFEDPDADSGVYCTVDNVPPSTTVSIATGQDNPQDGWGLDSNTRRVHFKVWFQDDFSVNDNGFGPEDIIVKDVNGNDDLSETKQYRDYDRVNSIFSSVFPSGVHLYNRNVTVEYSDPAINPDDYPDPAENIIGRMYDVYVEPRRDCDVQIRVAKEAVIDDAGNTSLEPGYGPTVTFNDAPEMRIEPVNSNTSNSSTLNFKIEASEPIYGFGTGSVWVEPVSTPGCAGGTKTAVVTGSLDPGMGGSVFNVAVSGMTYPGFVRISTDAAAGAAKVNTTRYQYQYTWPSSVVQVDYDGVAPGGIHFDTPASIVSTGTNSGSYTTSKPIMDIAGYSTDAFSNYDFTWSNNRGDSGSCYKAATLISTPSVTTTHSGPIIYLVSYPNASNVSLGGGDVTLVKTGTANGTIAVSGDNPRVVAINNVSGTGTLGVSINSGTALFDGGLSAPAAASSQSVTVTAAIPSMRAFILPPLLNGFDITYDVVYSDATAAITLTPQDVTLVKTGSADGFVTVDSNRIIVSDLNGSGTIGVAIDDNVTSAVTRSDSVMVSRLSSTMSMPYIDEEPVYGGQMNWAKNGISLKPGENIITFSSSDAAGNELNYSLAVNCTNPYWIDKVDTSGVGTHTSLALDDSGNPHICYYNLYNGDLDYAVWNGQSWTTQIVDGAVGSGESADVGQYGSLALDSDGNPCISYYDNTNGDLKYAYWNGSAWYRDTIAGESSAADNVGQYTSLVLDSLGRLHISYYDVANQRLMYVRGSSAANPTWTTPINVDPAGGSVGQYNSIALDPVIGVPGIAYYDSTHSSLKYAVGNAADASSFTPDTVDTGSVGTYASLKYGSTGTPHISYYSAAGGDLKYAAYNTGTSSWDISSVDTGGSTVGQYSSLALDSQENPHISYYDSTNGDLKYAVDDGSLTWPTKITLDDGIGESGASTCNVGQYCSLQLDSNDNPHISYYDMTNADLKYLFKSGTGGAGSGPTCVVTGPTSPTSASPLYFDMTFSQAVTGLDAGRISVTGGDKGSLAEITPFNGTTYRLSVTPPATGGQVSCYVPFGAARAGEYDNLQSNTVVVTYDGAKPSVTINRMYSQADPTASLPIHFTVVFSEPVTGFTGSDIVISGSAGGTKSVILSGNGTTYDAAVYGMTTAGSVIATIPAGVAIDVAGNTSTASGGSSDNTVWYDGTAPTVTINQASTQSDPTKNTVINFTAVFSEPVIRLTGTWTKTVITTDVDIDNKVTITGTASFIDNSGNDTRQAVITAIGTPDAYGHYRTFNVAISGMTSRGTVVVSIPAGAASDCSEDGTRINDCYTSASDDNSVTYDETSPTVTFNKKSGQTDPTNLSPIRFDVVFSKDVDDFSGSDVVVGGTAVGTITKAVSGGPRNFTVEISGMQVPSGQTSPASVVLSIPAGVAHDAAGNGNTAGSSNDNTVLFDNVRPNATITKASTQNDSTYATEINYTVAFSEPVTGFGIHRDTTTNDIDVDDIVLSGTAVPDDWRASASGWDYEVTQINPGDGTTYNVKVTGMDPDVPGTVVAEIGENVAQDAIGNLNMSSADATDVSLRQASVLYFPEHCDAPGASIDKNGVTDTEVESTIDLSSYYGTITDLNVKLSITHTYDSDLTGILTGPDGTQVILFSRVGSNGANFTNTIFDDQSQTGVASGVAPFAGSYKPQSNLSTFAGKSINGKWKLRIVDSQRGHSGTLDSWCMQATIVNQTGPSVTINKVIDQADPTQNNTINFIVVFSKPVTGFDDTDVTLGGSAGATTAAVTGSGTSYNVAVSGMTTSGTVTASLNADVVVDSIGIGNLASTSTDNEVYYETVLTASIATSTDAFTSAPVTFTVNFNKPVADFTKADVTIGGTAPFASSPVVTVQESGTIKMVYIVSVSGMKGAGTVTAKIGANVAHDGSGFGNSASGTATASFAPQIPSVIITQADDQEDPTRTQPIKFKVVFSEPVTGFTNTDVALSGDASASTVAVTDTGDQTVFVVDVSGMTKSGNVIASVIKDAAVNASGVGNTASPETSKEVDNIVYYDTTPTVTIDQASGQADPSNASVINFTAVFSSAVTGFTSEDVLLSGTAVATTADITDSGDHKTYNVAISGMTGLGTVIADIRAGAAKDVYDQVSLASTSKDNVVNCDGEAPTVTVALASGQAGIAKVGPVDFAVTFSEPVVGFTGDKVSTSGSTVGGTLTAKVTEISPYNGSKYNVAINGMNGEGNVKLAIEAGKVTDEAGNGNQASTTETPGTSDTVYFDNVAPMATIEQADGQADPTTDLPVKFKVTLSEAVPSFTIDDIDISNSTAGDNLSVDVSQTDPLTYEVTIDGLTHSGTVIINVPENTFTDAAGNGNVNLEDGSNVIDNQVLYNDQTNATVTVTQTVNEAQHNPSTNTPPIRFRVSFSKPVTGFDDPQTDLVISGTAGGTKTAVITGVQGSAIYQVAVSGVTSTGTVQLDIPDGVVLDLSGVNSNDASISTNNIVTYDITPPTVTIQPAFGQESPTSDSPVHFTVTFTEPVAGFVAADAIVSGTANPAHTVVTPSDGVYHTSYDVAVSGMTGSGSVVLSVPAGVAYDSAGNLNKLGVLIDPIEFNRPGPTVTLTKGDTHDPANTSPIFFKVEFSSPVTGFATGDVVLGGSANPTSATVSGKDDTYVVAVSGMANSGDVKVSIPENVAIDTNSHGNAASDDCTVKYDNVPPSVTISKADGQEDPTKILPINFTVVFSEGVSGFTKSDIAISGTAKGTRSIAVTETGPMDHTTYRVSVSGLTAAGTVVAAVPAGVAVDTADNGNTASNSVSVAYNWQPLTTTLSLATGQSSPTNNTTIAMKVVFSSAVIDFTTGDITLGGTAGASSAVVTDSGDQKTYNVAVGGMNKTGTVTAIVAAGVAHNSDSDANAASSSLSVTFDNAPPTITITSPTAASECTRNCNTVSLAGTASDNSGVAEVRWSNAGTDGACSGTTSWSVSELTIADNGTDSYNDTITITATDSAGNTASDSLKVNVLERTPGSAWTSVAMVSLPIIPDETDPKLAVDFYSNSWAMFDTASNSYILYPDDLTWLDPANETPGRGFWARFGSKHATPTGMIPSQTQEATIHLKPGWNMIGNPFVSNVIWDSSKIAVEYMSTRLALNRASDLVGNYAWGWDASVGSYYLVYDAAATSDENGYLAPWQAYWIKATVKCDLILPAP